MLFRSLAKALAQAVFGQEDAMIRLDMSEYMEKHSVSKLVGSPPGYVGYDEAGQLTEQLRRKPYCVLLFDEIEKAHPDVFNILLQVLDDGRITDSHGRTVDFKNSVIIMTSNAGASQLQNKRSLGFGEADSDAQNRDMKDQLKEALKRTFRPEFLNRIDDIVIFNQLTQPEIQQIAGKLLDQEVKRLAQAGVQAEYDQAVLEHLAQAGFDPVYGARPLRRAIQAQVEDLAAMEILEGRLKQGDKALISAADGAVTIAALPPKQQEERPEEAPER